MKRRDFLRSTGWFVVGAAAAGLPGCGDNFAGATPELLDAPGTYAFPQGVASGDPRETSVVLWTRAVRAGATGTFGAIGLRVEVSTDPGFATLIVDERVIAGQPNDHTVRVTVIGLSGATTYYYRFTAGQDTISGRTRTAPPANADVQVNLAWVSCQDYSAGHYGAYRQMIVDDDARAEADRIQVVVHLGDMIYETRADGFQAAIDDNFSPILLTNRDGKPRTVGPFPSGGGTRAKVNFAATVDDYRSLYRTFLSDPDVQAARARWPFVAVWDDHEFTDDCWQSQANYDNAKTLDEPDQPRRIAASQAWFEYVPCQLTGAVGVPGVANEAHDFSPADVVSAPFTAANADNFVAEPNNDAAINAIRIYRSLRFGKHVELVMTDERSYRSDHAIPEELTNNAAFFAPRNALPLPVVNLFDAGKTANGGTPPASITIGQGPFASTFPNVRAGSPPGTMLGKQQKAWWKATMKGSDATWKLWGNEVTLMRLRLAQAGTPELLADRVIAGDSWDGYTTERTELMGFLKSEGIKNVVVLSGDVHAGFAGTIVDDFDAAAPQPVAFEVVAPGISSNSLFSFFEAATRPPIPATLRGLITADATAGGGPKFAENLNMLLLNGTNSAGVFASQAATKPFATALANALSFSDAMTNPHLKYADTNAQGYGYVKATATALTATLVTINRPLTVPGAAGPGIKRTATFTVPKDNPGGATGPVLTGTKPFPLS
jgi:alkaline phosphatase D